MKSICIAIVLIFSSSWVQAQSTTQADAFTKSFYDWYLQKGKNRTTESVLLHKKEVLSPDLYKLLNADREAQAKSPGELVGLGFDPFLNAQDVAQKYEFGKAVLKGSNYWIDVYGLWNGEKSKKPDLTAEINCSAAACQFVDFHYEEERPQDRSLIQVLKVLKKEKMK